MKVNDAAVKAIWLYLKGLEERVTLLEARVEFLRGQVRARLKEEAEGRESSYLPSGPEEEARLED